MMYVIDNIYVLLYKLNINASNNITSDLKNKLISMKDIKIEDLVNNNFFYMMKCVKFTNG